MTVTQPVGDAALVVLSGEQVTVDVPLEVLCLAGGVLQEIHKDKSRTRWNGC